MADEIIRRLPQYYNKSQITYGITEGIESELMSCRIRADELDKELSISTAVKNLSRWEGDLKIHISPIPQSTHLSDFAANELNNFTVDELKNMTVDGTVYNDWYILRRSNILAKMRGYGICTKELIQSITASYTNGDVEVDDSNANNYIIWIYFTTKTGKPTALEQIKNAINVVIPAHLIVKYRYKYRTWDEVLENSNSWNDLVLYTWQEILEREEILNGENRTL